MTDIPSAQKYGETEQLGIIYFRCHWWSFYFRPFASDQTREMGLSPMHMPHGTQWHLRQTANLLHTTMVIQYPCGCFGWLERFSGPTNSLTISVTLCWLGSKSPRNMRALFQNRDATSGLSVPYWGISPPESTLLTAFQDYDPGHRLGWNIAPPTLVFIPPSRNLLYR